MKLLTMGNANKNNPLTESVIVTGATGKLGIFLAQQILEFTTYKVILTSRSKSKLNVLIGKLESANTVGRIITYPLSLEHSKSIENFIIFITQLPCKVIGLVNNAAVDNVDPLFNVTFNKINELLKINFTGNAYLSTLLLKYWNSNNISASVITISTLLTRLGSKNSACYAASKAALESFFINYAIETGELNIRSNILRIAGMLGNLVLQGNDMQDVAELDQKIYTNESLDHTIIPLKKFGKFTDYTNVILFLLSEKSSYITGQIINVDGGLSSLYPGYIVKKYE